MDLHGSVYVVGYKRVKSIWENVKVFFYGIVINYNVVMNPMNGVIANGV